MPQAFISLTSDGYGLQQIKIRRLKNYSHPEHGKSDKKGHFSNGCCSQNVLSQQIHRNLGRKKVHLQQGEAHPWDYSGTKPIQEHWGDWQGVDCDRSQSLKSHHSQTHPGLAPRPWKSRSKVKSQFLTCLKFAVGGEMQRAQHQPTSLTGQQTHASFLSYICTHTLLQCRDVNSALEWQ